MERWARQFMAAGSGQVNNRPVVLMIVFSLLFVISGCGVAQRASQTPETDALIRAARSGNVDTVKALLTAPDVNVNGIDEQGNTALIEAARYGHDHVVTVLLMAKADSSAKNHEGKTALMLATEGGHDETVRALTNPGIAR
jgi:hypothetical protein